MRCPTCGSLEMTPLRKGGWLCEECDNKVGVTPPTLLDLPAYKTNVEAPIHAPTTSAAASSSASTAPSACARCGTKNPDGAAFCLDCGQDLRAPVTSTTQTAAARCPACRALVSAKARFCEHCGARVSP